VPDAKRRRPKIGDLIKIATPRGFGYAQYTHKNDRYGELIRVLPGLYESPSADLLSLAKQKERFYTFFRVGPYVWRGIVAIAGHAEVPEEAQPFPLFRARGGIDNNGRVLNWWLWDGNRSWFIGDLKAEQHRLPLAEVWNDTLLIERIASEWMPEDVT
jgi:hypothetical protein